MKNKENGAGLSSIGRRPVPHSSFFIHHSSFLSSFPGNGKGSRRHRARRCSRGDRYDRGDTRGAGRRSGPIDRPRAARQLRTPRGEGSRDPSARRESRRSPRTRRTDSARLARAPAPGADRRR